MIERQEGRGADASTAQVPNGRPRVLEALHDDPLQALAEHRFDRTLESGRHVEQIGDRADDAGDRRPPVGGEHRAHAGAVALADALELAQRLAARTARRELETRVRQTLFRRAERSLAVGEQPFEARALLGQRAELGGHAITRHLEDGAMRRQPRGLALRLRQLAGQALAATGELGLALAELAGLAHQIGAFRGQPHLLETQHIDTIPFGRERLTVPLDLGGERGRRRPALDDRRLRLGESAPALLALAPERREPLAGDAEVFLQAYGFLVQLPELHAHLLAALQQPLELALHLLHALPQIAEPVLAGLDGLALHRLL